MAQLDDKARKFLADNAFAATVTTLRADGSPHSTIVWVDVVDDGTPSFNTARGRAKARHLENDPRVSLMMVDPADQYRWVAIDGTAELTEDGADAQIDKLAKKYLDADEYPFRNAEETRLQVRIRPAHVETRGLD
jgi:PPOX class probable F420-dependent enzyme